MSMRDVVKDFDKLKKFARAAFETIDTDKSGYLEREELEAVMANVANEFGSNKPTREEVDEVLHELDENGDGRISLTEFLVLIEQVLSIMAQEEEQHYASES